MAKIIVFMEYNQASKRTKSHTQYVDYIERKSDIQKDSELINRQEKEWQELCQNLLAEQGNPPSFEKYLNYLQRDQEEDLKRLKKGKVLASDNGYKTLSGNEGMFDGHKDMIDDSQRCFYHQHFQKAYDENAILWKPIISFEQGFLEEVNIVKENVVNEEKLKQATRNAMDNFVKKNNLPPMYWTGMVHYDTDNVHIHVAMVEKSPTNVTNWTQDEIKQFAKCSVSSFESIKRDMATQLLDRSQQKKELTQHIRQRLIQPTRELNIVKDFPIQSKDLLHKLSSYQYGKLKPIEKAWVNSLTTQILHAKFPNEFQEFRYLVNKENTFYQELYGNKKHEQPDYATNLERDVYYRIGNVILKQLQVEKAKERVTSKSPNNNRSEMALAVYQMAYTNQKLSRDLARASQKAQSKHSELLDQINYQQQIQERTALQHGGYSISL